MMTMAKSYTAPINLEDVAKIAAEADTTMFAGGTDLFPRWAKAAPSRPAAIVDLKKIKELSGIRVENDEVSVGACTLMSELDTNPVIRTAAPVLAEAAGRIACAQIRNRATLGGNLCNASPAADTAVPLLLLDATLELASSKPAGVSTREVQIIDFFCGPGVTVLMQGEILTRVRFKALPADVFRRWDKFGTRPAMEIAVASVGVILQREDNLVTHARVAYGSVAPTPLRGRLVEAELIGHRLDVEVIDRCVAAARKEISPITDLRASAEYREDIVGITVRRMLEHAERS